MALSMQAVANAAKVFNKGGYRLASKTVGEVVANMPKGAVSKTTVIAEHISGDTIKVESYIDKFGKAVKLNKVNNNTGDCATTFLDWQRSYMHNGSLYDVTLKTRTSGTKDGSFHILRNISYSPVEKITDILESSSKLSGSKTNGSKELYTRIFQCDNGKVKEISKLTKKVTTPTSTKTVVEKSGQGIPENEVEEISSYPYFDSMFLDKKDMLRFSVDTACQRQGVSAMNLSFPEIAESDRRVGWCNYWKNELAVTSNGMKGSKGYLFDTLEHEARHKWQHDLVEKMKRGELTNPQDIELAKKFEKEFANYIDSNKDIDGYYKQLVEVDARNAGAKAENSYKNVQRLLDRHFGYGPSDDSFMAGTI